MIRILLLVCSLFALMIVATAAAPPGQEGSNADEGGTEEQAPPTEEDSSANNDGYVKMVSCSASVGGPSMSGSTVRGSAAYSCYGGHWSQELKLKSNLKRHRFLWFWSTLDSHSTGWLSNVQSISSSLDGSCTSGQHNYRTYAKGQMRDDDGGSNSDTSQRSRRLTC